MMCQKKFTVVPLRSINRVEFGTDREAVRKIFKGKYKEVKRNAFSENTMDSHDDYNLYYTKDDRLEAVEVFGKVKVMVDGRQVFPGKTEDAISMFPQMKEADDGFIDETNSVAITVNEDDDGIIDSILFAVKGYYD